MTIKRQVTFFMPGRKSLKAVMLLCLSSAAMTFTAWHRFHKLCPFLTPRPDTYSLRGSRKYTWPTVTRRIGGGGGGGVVKYNAHAHVEPLSPTSVGLSRAGLVHTKVLPFELGTLTREERDSQHGARSRAAEDACQ